MAMPKTRMLSYAKNVGKSISYSAIDAIKQSNPAIAGFVDSNKDTMKGAYNAIAHAGRTFSELTNQFMDSKYGDLGKQALKNVKEDLKSGKWYNLERSRKAEDAAIAASGWGDDDEDFGFESMANGDFDFGSDDDALDLDSMVDLVGKKSSQAVSEAIVQTTEEAINAQANIAKATAKHNEALYANIHAGMGTINENLGKLIEIANGPFTTHMDNSKTFFESETKLSEERNQILKEMLDIQKSIYKKEQKAAKNKISMYSIMDENGMPDLELYFERIMKNINDNTGGMGDLIKDAVEGGGLEAIVSSPLQAITDTIAKKLIPAALDKTMRQFNRSLGGLFSSGMAKLMNTESDSPILTFIKNTLGITDVTKTSINVDKYDKGAVPFDGITRKSITEVIPTYLARIESALMSLSGISGKEIMKLERRFNFDTGKFVNANDIKKNFRYITASEKERANNDITKYFDKFMNMIDFGDDEKRKKQIRKNFNKVMDQSFETGVLFNPKEIDKYAMTDYNMTGDTADEDLELIRKIFETIPKDVMLNYANNVYSAKNSISSQMERLESSGHDISSALFNDSFASVRGKGSPKKKKKGKSSGSKKGSKGKNQTTREDNKSGGDKKDSSDDDEEPALLEYVRRMQEYSDNRRQEENKNTDDEEPALLEHMRRMQEYSDNRRIQQEKERWKKEEENINADEEPALLEYMRRMQEHSDNRIQEEKNRNKLIEEANKKGEKITITSAKKYCQSGINYVEINGTQYSLNEFLDNCANNSPRYTLGQYLKRRSKNTTAMNTDDEESAMLDYMRRMQESSDIRTPQQEENINTQGAAPKRGKKGDITREKAKKRVRKGKNTVVKIDGKRIDLNEFVNNTTDKEDTYTLNEYLDELARKANQQQPTGFMGGVRRLAGIDNSAGTDDEKIEKVAFDKDDIEGTALQTIDKLMEMKEKEESKDKKKKSKLREKLDDAANSSSGIAKLVTNVEKLIKKPTDFLAGIIKKADNAIYELIFGVEYDENGERKSVAKAIFDGLRDSFDDFREWMKKTLKPIRDWFNKEGTLGNKAKKFVEKQFGNISESEFGEQFRKFFHITKKTVEDAAGSVASTVKEDLAQDKDKMERTDSVIDQVNDKVKEEKEKGKKSKKKGKVEGEGETEPVDDGKVQDNGKAAAGMRRVSKTGVIAVSAGEMVVPPDLNPANIRKREANENREKKKFANSLADRIKGFASGGEFTEDDYEDLFDSFREEGEDDGEYINDIERQAGEDAKSFNDIVTHWRIKKKEKIVKIWLEKFSTDPDSALAEYESLSKEDKETLLKAFSKNKHAKKLVAILKSENRKNMFSGRIEKGKNAVKDAWNRGKELAEQDKEGAEGQTQSEYIQSVISKALNVNGEMTEEQKKMLNEGLGDIKNHIPEALGGATIGTGISFLTGAFGGPLVGAAVGAGISLIKNSESINRMLFGDKLTDENGNVIGRKGNGLLSEELTKNIHKYAPGMGKGAILGGITALLPITPFGPFAGILLGSATGFAANNEKIRESLFGEEGLWKDGDKKIKKALPALGMGAAAGLIMGPFGMLPNIMLGSAAGFATTTDKFKDLLFGKKDEDGNRHGGIIETAVHGLFKPIGDFTKDTINDLVSWADKNIKQPLKDAVDPIKKQFKLMFQGIHNGINKLFKETLGSTLDEMIRDKLFKPITGFFKKAMGIALKPFKTAISLPFKLIGGIGNKLRDRQVKRGQADYMTADERIAWREKRGLFRSSSIMPWNVAKTERNKKYDHAYSLMGGKESGELADQLEMALDSGKTFEGQKQKAIKNFNKDIRKTTKLSAKQLDDLADKIKKYVEKEKGSKETAIKGAHAIIDKYDIPDKDKKELKKTVDEFIGSIQEIYDRKDKFSGDMTAFKEALAETDSFKEAGITARDIKDEDLPNMLRNLRAEQKAKSASEEEGESAPTEKGQQERHNEIIDQLESINTSLQALTTIDPEQAAANAEALSGMYGFTMPTFRQMKQGLFHGVGTVAKGAWYGGVQLPLAAMGDIYNVARDSSVGSTLFGNRGTDWRNPTPEDIAKFRNMQSHTVPIENAAASAYRATTDAGRQLYDTVKTAEKISTIVGPNGKPIKREEESDNAGEYVSAEDRAAWREARQKKNNETAEEVVNRAAGGSFGKDTLAAVSKGEVIISPDSIKNYAGGGLPGSGDQGPISSIDVVVDDISKQASEKITDAANGGEKSKTLLSRLVTSAANLSEKIPIFGDVISEVGDHIADAVTDSKLNQEMVEAGGTLKWGKNKVTGAFNRIRSRGDEDPELGNAAAGKEITKPGLIAASKGEYIVSPDIDEELENTLQEAIENFASGGKIPGQGEVDENQDAKNNPSLFDKIKEKAANVKDKVKYEFSNGKLFKFIQDDEGEYVLDKSDSETMNSMKELKSEENEKKGFFKSMKELPMNFMGKMKDMFLGKEDAKDKKNKKGILGKLFSVFGGGKDATKGLLGSAISAVIGIPLVTGMLKGFFGETDIGQTIKQKLDGLVQNLNLGGNLGDLGNKVIGGIVGWLRGEDGAFGGGLPGLLKAGIDHWATGFEFICADVLPKAVEIFVAALPEIFKGILAGIKTIFTTDLYNAIHGGPENKDLFQQNKNGEKIKVTIGKINANNSKHSFNWNPNSKGGSTSSDWKSILSGTSTDYNGSIDADFSSITSDMKLADVSKTTVSEESAKSINSIYDEGIKNGSIKDYKNTESYKNLSEGMREKLDKQLEEMEKNGQNIMKVNTGTAENPKYENKTIQEVLAMDNVTLGQGVDENGNPINLTGVDVLNNPNGLGDALGLDWQLTDEERQRNKEARGHAKHTTLASTTVKAATKNFLRGRAKHSILRTAARGAAFVPFIGKTALAPALYGADAVITNAGRLGARVMPDWATGGAKTAAKEAAQNPKTIKGKLAKKLKDKIFKKGATDTIADDVARNATEESAESLWGDYFKRNGADDVAEKMMNGADDVVNGAERVRMTRRKISPLNRAKNKISNLKDTAIDKVKNTKAGSKVANVVGKVKDKAVGLKDKLLQKTAGKESSGIVKQIMNTITKNIRMLVSNNAVLDSIGEALGKLGKKCSKKAVEEVVDRIVKQIEKKLLPKFAEKLAVAGVKTIGKVAAQVCSGGIFTAFFAATSFYDGFAHCESVLGVVEDNSLVDYDPSFGTKLITAIVSMLNDIFLLGILPLDVVFDFLYEGIKDVFGIDDKELTEARKKSEEIVKEYNMKHDENLTIQEYNAKDRWTTKLKKGAGDFFLGKVNKETGKREGGLAGAAKSGWNWIKDKAGGIGNAAKGAWDWITGKDTSKPTEEEEKALQAYNAKYGTNLSMENYRSTVKAQEYNKKHGTNMQVQEYMNENKLSTKIGNFFLGKRNYKSDDRERQGGLVGAAKGAITGIANAGKSIAGKAWDLGKDIGNVSQMAMDYATYKSDQKASERIANEDAENPLHSFNKFFGGAMDTVFAPIRGIFTIGKGIQKVVSGVMDFAGKFAKQVQNDAKRGKEDFDKGDFKSYFTLTQTEVDAEGNEVHNPLSPFRTFIKASTRILNFPILGIQWVGKQIGEKVSNIIKQAKTVLTVVGTVAKGTIEMANNGNLEEYFNFSNGVESDNKFGWLNTAITGATRIAMLPVVGGIKIGNKIKEGISTIINAAKTTIGLISSAAGKTIDIAKNGSIGEYFDFTNEKSEEKSQFGWLNTAITGATRIAMLPVVGGIFVGDKIKKGITSLISGVKTTFDVISDNTAKTMQIAKEGTLSEYFDFTNNKSDKLPFDWMSTAFTAVSRIVMMPAAAGVAIGTKIKEGIGSIIDGIKSLATDNVKDQEYVKKYYDKKNLDGYWDSPVKKEGFTGVILSVMGTINRIAQFIPITITQVVGKIGDAIAKPIKWVKEKIGGFADGVAEFFGVGGDIDEEGKNSKGQTAALGEGGSGTGLLSKIHASGSKPESDPKYKDDPSFVSQVDNKYANSSFNIAGDSKKQTIRDTGCGPAAAAMVVNNATNAETLNMKTAAKDALKYKVKDGGVNAAYFENEFSKHGISTNYILDEDRSARNQNIMNSLYSGNRTVLMGSDPTNKSKGMSPYGPKDHYIVATRASKDGKYIWINDPESKTPEVRYPASTILNSTKMGIAGVAASGSGLLGKIHARGSELQINRMIQKMSASGKYGPDTVEYKVWNGLRAAGYDEIHVAAIMGNLYQESEFKPEAIEKANGVGFGLVQWSRGRRTGIENYAKSIGVPATDLIKVQIPFLIAEMTPGGGCNGFANYEFMKQTKAGKTWAADSFMTATDLATATAAFCWTFERPSEAHAHLEDRRLPAAKGYYEAFTGQPIDVSLSSGISSGTDSNGSNDTGGTVLDKIFGAIGNFAKAFGLSSDSVSASTSATSMAGIVSEKQQQLVEKMKSVEGKLDYSQSARNPDQGSGDCSSTVQWAYKNVLGPEGDPGDWSGAYETSANTYTVTDKLDPNVMQPGDAIVYNKHVEMYAGDGQMIGHGGPGKGPTTKPLSDKNGRFKMVRRWNGFKDLPLLDPSTTGETNSATGEITTDESGAKKVAKDNKIRTGVDHNPNNRLSASGSGLNPNKDVSISDTMVAPDGKGYGDKRGFLKKSRYDKSLNKNIKVPASVYAAGSDTDEIINKVPVMKHILRRKDDNKNDKINAYLSSILRLLAKEVENTSMLNTIVTILKELIKTYEEERKLRGNSKDIQQKREALENKRESMLNILNATGIQGSGQSNDLTKLIKDAERLASI